MKAFFFFLLLAVLATRATAQFVPLLETLEGHWVQTDKTAAMDWRFVDDQTVTGLLYRLIQADTLPQVAMRVNCAGPLPEMTLSTDGQTHTFRLVAALPYEQDWQNVDPAARPQRLHLQRYPGSRAVVRLDAQEMLYRRKNRPGLQVTAGVQAGLTTGSLGKRPTVARSPVAYPRQAYTWQTGHEAALVLGLEAPRSGFAFHVEIGELDYRYGVDELQTVGGVPYKRNGNYHIRTPYVGLAPQMYLGHQQAWRISAGAHLLLRPRVEFDGTDAAYASDGRFLANPQARRLPLFFAGMVYAPTWPVVRWLRPAVYTRVTGIPTRGNFRAVSAGLRIGI